MCYWKCRNFLVIHKKEKKNNSVSQFGDKIIALKLIWQQVTTHYAGAATSLI